MTNCKYIFKKCIRILQGSITFCSESYISYFFMSLIKLIRLIINFNSPFNRIKLKLLVIKLSYEIEIFTLHNRAKNERLKIGKRQNTLKHKRKYYRLRQFESNSYNSCVD